MFYINARSVKNKTLYLNDYIATHEYDLIAISETWFMDSDSNEVYINALLPAGYGIKHMDRDGGGVALIYKQSINIQKTERMKYTQSNEYSLKSSDDKFVEEMAEFLSHQTIRTSGINIIGDLNIQLTIIRVNYILEDCGVKQHVSEPSHYLGHALDVFITRDNSGIISKFTVKDIGLCDNDGNHFRNHYAMICTVRRKT